MKNKRFLSIILLTVFLCSSLYGIPVAQANDTSNRVFYYTLSTQANLDATKVLYPFANKTANVKTQTVSKTISPITITSEKTGVTINGSINFDQYYPWAYVLGSDDTHESKQTYIYNWFRSNWQDSRSNYIIPTPTYNSGRATVLDIKPEIEFITEGKNGYIKNISFPTKVVAARQGSDSAEGSYAKVPIVPNSYIKLSGNIANYIWKFQDNYGNTDRTYTVSGTKFYQTLTSITDYTGTHNTLFGIGGIYVPESAIGLPGYQHISYVDPYFGQTVEYDQLTIVIPADDPSIVLSNITVDKATIDWSTNNINPEGTTYTVQYQILTGSDVNNEADWSAWSDIEIDGSASTTLKSTTASIFTPDQTYRLRVRVNHIAGASYYVYSDYVIFSTSADPAVRAAQEAATAAQAAKVAAEETVAYAQAAKDASTAAEVKATEAVNLIKGLDLSMAPTIMTAKGQNGATATTANTFPVVINASNAVYYRAGIDGTYTEWQTSPIINVPITKTGVVEIEVQAKRSSDASAAITSSYLTIFVL